MLFSSVHGLQEIGKLRIQGDGVIFKSTSTDKVSQVKHSEIDTLEWMRAARGFGVKVMSREGHMFKFDGFKESVRMGWLHNLVPVTSLRQ